MTLIEILNKIAYLCIEASLLVFLMWMVTPRLQTDDKELKLLAVPLLGLYLFFVGTDSLLTFLGMAFIGILIMKVCFKRSTMSASMYMVVVVVIKLFAGYLVAFRELLYRGQNIGTSVITYMKSPGDFFAYVIYIVFLLLAYRFFINGLRQLLKRFKVAHLVIFIADLGVVVVMFGVLNFLYRFFLKDFVAIINIEGLNTLMLIVVNVFVGLAILLMYLMNSFWLTHFQFKAYQSVAEVDELTGVWNRQSCFRKLKQLMRQFDSSNRNFVICFIDVNNLKVVNDKFGHNEGDRMITSIASTIAKGLRDNDFIARIGGDEFIVCFENCKKKDALVAWSRIGNELDKMNLSMDFAYKVSVSTGFASFEENSHLNLKQLIEKADEEMYDNKRKYKTKMV